MNLENVWDNLKVFITASAVAAAIETMPELRYLPHGLSIIFGLVLSIKLAFFWVRFRKQTAGDTGVPFVCLRVSEFKAAIVIASIHALLLIGAMVLYIAQKGVMTWAMSWTFAGVSSTGAVALYFFARQVMRWMVVSKKQVEHGERT